MTNEVVAAPVADKANPAPAIAPTPPAVATQNYDGVIQDMMLKQREAEDRISALSAQLSERAAPAQLNTPAADAYADPLAKEVAEMKTLLLQQQQQRENERTAFANQQVIHGAVTEAQQFAERFALAHPVTAANPKAAETVKSFVVGEVKKMFQANPRSYVTPFQLQQAFNAQADNLGAIIAAQVGTGDRTAAAIASATAQPAVTGGVAADPNARPPKTGSDEWWEMKRAKSAQVFASQRNQ